MIHLAPLRAALLAGALALAWLGATSAHARIHDVATAGAVGDGAGDQTEVFQKTLDLAASEGGGIVNVPSGRYAIRGNLRIPANVTLQGEFNAPPTVIEKGPAVQPQGSVLMAYAGRGSQEGPAFITMAGSNSSLKGLTVVYPEWNQKDVPPVPYPPCVQLKGVEDVGLTDLLLMNPYEGIRCELSHRFFVRNVFGYPQWRGLFIDECYDINRVENIHFWPFGTAYSPEDPFNKWINLNGVAFEFARTDWQYVTHTFCFGYGVGYKFSAKDHGGCNGSFVGIGADCCRRAMLVEEMQPAGLLITNGEFVGRWESQDSVTIEIGEKAVGKVGLVNCSFWGPIDRCILTKGPKAWLTATNCHFWSWDQGKLGSPAIDAQAGKVNLQGNTFTEGQTHLHVGPQVKSAIAMGNQADGGFKVKNEAGDLTQSIGNEAVPAGDAAAAEPTPAPAK